MQYMCVNCNAQINVFLYKNYFIHLLCNNIFCVSTYTSVYTMMFSPMYIYTSVHTTLPLYTTGTVFILLCTYTICQNTPVYHCCECLRMYTSGNINCDGRQRLVARQWRGRSAVVYCRVHVHYLLTSSLVQQHPYMDKAEAGAHRTYIRLTRPRCLRCHSSAACCTSDSRRCSTCSCCTQSLNSFLRTRDTGK